MKRALEKNDNNDHLSYVEIIKSHLKIADNVFCESCIII